jgi:hypothetical protein
MLMPRMTRKYAAALRTAHLAGLAEPGDWAEDQEQVYRTLNEAGYCWDSDIGGWRRLADEPADDPTEFIMVRLWAAGEVIEELADDVIAQLRAAGLRCLERSEIYPCRPPKHLEARVYLKFLPERKFRIGGGD